MTEIADLVEEISAFEKELEQVQEPSVPADRKVFTLLLSGISACRKIPGIEEHMGYERPYRCPDQDAAERAGKYLKDRYGISGKESLKEAMLREFSDCEQYEQFRTFWIGAPMFRMEEMLPENREWFQVSKDMAEQFCPLVRERGFYAWDISEKIGLCRKAAACGLISEEEFQELTDPPVRMAQVFYHSFQEYAVSCLCGAVYFMRRRKEELPHFLKLNMDLVRQLFADGMAWQKYAWYVPESREWADLFDTSQECLITRKALEEERIGYMYRQEPQEEPSDCGWRFMTGDETEAYVSTPENIVMCTYSDVYNLDPSVRAYFYADYGMQYVKTEEGWAQVR